MKEGSNVSLRGASLPAFNTKKRASAVRQASTWKQQGCLTFADV
eukprot:IDg10647t1